MLRRRHSLQAVDGVAVVPDKPVDTFEMVTESQIALSDSSDGFLSGISGMGRSIAVFLTRGPRPAGKNFKPTIAGTGHSDQSELLRDTALIEEAHKAGVDKIGLELTEVHLKEENIKTYFTALANYARELGIEVVPLLKDETLLKLRSMSIAVRHINAGRFDMGRLRTSVARAARNYDELTEMTTYWSPENPGWAKLTFHMREARARGMALEMIEEIRGDIYRFVEKWREVCDELVSSEMMSVIKKHRLRLAIMGSAHIPNLPGNLKSYQLIRKEDYVADLDPLTKLIRLQSSAGNADAILILDYLGKLLDKFGVERGEEAERQDFLVHLLSTRPELVQFIIRSFIPQFPELVDLLNPNESFDALMATCKEAKERVERTVRDALKWFRFEP